MYAFENHAKFLFLVIFTIGNMFSIFKKKKEIWVGALYMQAQVQDMGSFPQFTMMSEASRCYLVKYNDEKFAWKFFWSKPGQYGEDGNFVTNAMKENQAPRGSNRYFNDATDVAQLDYNSTLTLDTELMLDDGGKSFIYRQHFDNWTGAFQGSLTLTDPKNIPTEWLNIFEKNAPS